MSKIYREAKTTVRGIGSVEVVYIQQTRSSGQYEIGTSYVKGLDKILVISRPASEFANTLQEAMDKMGVQVMSLIMLKQMNRSLL